MENWGAYRIGAPKAAKRGRRDPDLRVLGAEEAGSRGEPSFREIALVVGTECLALAVDSRFRANDE